MINKVLVVVSALLIVWSMSQCVNGAEEPTNSTSQKTNRGPRAEFLYLHLQSQLYNLLSQLYGHKSSVVSLRAQSQPEVNRLDTVLNQYLYGFQRLQSELNDIWKQSDDKEMILLSLNHFQNKINRFQTSLNDIHNQLVLKQHFPITQTLNYMPLIL